MATKRPTAPDHLRPATRRWFVSVLTDYCLEDHHRRLLSLAGTAWDRAEAAREVIDRDGAVFSDRFGQPKPRPEVGIERDATTMFARLVRELDLDCDPPGAERSRPPSLRSIRR